MKIPLGFECEELEKRVCKLRKSLHELKQSLRAWFRKFCSAMTRFGYVQGQADHTMFSRHSVNGKKSILIVHVDDMIIAGDDTQEINNLKERLKAEFEIKDLGNLRYFLGIEVVRSKNGIFISQRKYTLDLLAKTGKLGVNKLERPWI